MNRRPHIAPAEREAMIARAQEMAPAYRNKTNWAAAVAKAFDISMPTARNITALAALRSEAAA